MITQKIDEARGLEMQNKQQSKDENRTMQGSLVKSFVYGGLDGIVTTFAVVAGVAGADLVTGVVFILGVANLIADGISMAFGDYLSTKAENEYIEAERNRKTLEYDKAPSGEKKDMVDVYMEKGVPESEAKTVVDILSKYEKPWVDIIMVEQLGLIENDESPVKNALVTFGSFVIFGSIPVIVYIAARFIPFFALHTFTVAAVCTGITLFMLGALKVFFTRQRWYYAGLEMLFLGGLAALSAYIVGVWLGSLV